MDRRVCVWIRLLWLLVASFGLKIGRDYVDQLRYERVAARPCDTGVCALLNDQRTGDYFWVPLPDPPSRDIIPKQGL